MPTYGEINMLVFWPQDKLKLRLKTLEEGLRHVPGVSNKINGSPKNVKTGNLFGILSSNTRTKKRSTSLPRAFAIAKDPSRRRIKNNLQLLQQKLIQLMV